MSHLTSLNNIREWFYKSLHNELEVNFIHNNNNNTKTWWIVICHNYIAQKNDNGYKLKPCS